MRFRVSLDLVTHAVRIRDFFPLVYFLYDKVIYFIFNDHISVLYVLIVILVAFPLIRDILIPIGRCDATRDDLLQEKGQCCMLL